VHGIHFDLYAGNDQSEYRARMSLSAVTDEQGKVTHFIGIHDDISREHKLTERLNFQARHDALTGLYNRIEFESRGQALFTSCKEQEVEHALCFMDLDQFKVINDTCGHVAGDELLRQLAHVLSSTVRQSDMLARLGGDEFGVLMEHCTLEQAHRLAESIRIAVQEFRFVWDDQVFHIGISIGLVSINKRTSSLTELLKQADAACYMAKDLGRNRIHEYHHDDSSLVERQGEMLWVNRINRALEHDRFELFAQAIVPLHAQGGLHYELLVRMYGEEGEIIPPGSFLPAAERFDLMEKVDAWVIQQAFSTLSRHPEFVENIEFISINLSGASLTNGRFLDYLLEKLNHSKIPPGKVVLKSLKPLLYRT
jgi:diguanylate cyclase (GGDEF)-like protein